MTTDPRTPFATATAIVVLCALLAACGSLGRGRSAHGEATATIVACRMLFAEVDRTVATEGVRDAQTAGVAGHPYLRVSRFLAATAPAPTDGSAFDAWIERMRELDSRARDIELANLPAEVRAIIERAQRNPLVRPEPDKADAERLFAAFAPVYVVDSTGPYDLIGAPYWRNDQALRVDTERPVVHQRFAHTLYEGRTLLQLVYTAWFPERPSDHAFDLLAGHIDGLVWRVTLTPDGEPWVFDSMHPCGCYHQFFPTARAEARSAPDDLQEWAFVPQRLPRLSKGERVTIHVATRSHYIERITIDAPGGASTRYTLVPEDELRSLPMPSGERRSAFGTDGLMFGTERLERFFFWPMGIPSAGAMRQWGNHATAFVGERHFDDTDLFERRFLLR